MLFSHEPNQAFLVPDSCRLEQQKETVTVYALTSLFFTNYQLLCCVQNLYYLTVLLTNVSQFRQLKRRIKIGIKSAEVAYLSIE